MSPNQILGLPEREHNVKHKTLHHCVNTHVDALHLEHCEPSDSFCHPSSFQKRSNTWNNCIRNSLIEWDSSAQRKGGALIEEITDVCETLEKVNKVGYLLILPIQDLGAVSFKWPVTSSKQMVQMSMLLSQHISSLRNFNLRMLLVLKYLQEFKRWTDEWMRKSEKKNENGEDC